MSRTQPSAHTRVRRRARPRSTVAALACGVCALGLPASGLASHGTGDGSLRDYASRSGKNQFAGPLGEAHLSVAAHAGRDGGPPTGHVRAKGDPDGDATAFEPFALEGEVTCIEVRGNHAAIKYRFKHAEGSAELLQLEGGGVQIFIEDNGPPPQGGEPVDKTTFDEPQQKAAFEATNPSQCDDPTIRPYDQIESGDFTVHQAGAG